MFCKWCGMESATTDQCSWCHHTLSANATEEQENAAAAPEAAQARADSAPPADTVHDDHEESPLAAGLTAPAEMPKPQTPPPPAAPVLPASVEQEQAARPIIGVRRPDGSRGVGGRPAPAMPPPSRSASSGSRAHTPAPAMPPPQRTAASPSARPGIPMPQVPAQTGAAATAARPPEVATSRTGRLSVPTNLMGGAKAAVPETVNASVTAPAARMGMPVVEGEAGGLADGIAAPTNAPTPSNVPQLGTFTPAKSKYYSGQVIDPVSGTHYDSETGKATTATSAETTPNVAKTEDIVLNWDKPEVTMSAVLGKFLGVFAIVLAVAVGIASLAPTATVVALIVANFVGGLLLPVFGIVPWQDEDSDDAILMFLLSLMFGPVVSLIIYGGLTAIRQDGNAAVVGVLAVGALSHLVIRGLTGQIGSFMALMPFPTAGYSVSIMLLNWTGLFAMIGWFVANVFHKFDE
jgi:hypothetical protein